MSNDTDATRFKLRLLCADAPEKTQLVWGDAAKAKLR